MFHAKHSPIARAEDVNGGHGIGFPRLYDLLVAVMTGGRERAYRRHLVDLAEIEPGDALLDIGCGTGTLAIAAWHKVQPGGHVTGVDVSPRMIEVANAKARRRGADIAFQTGDAAALPFADNSFDVVTVTTVLHMLGDTRQRDCLGEALRVLRRGGRLLLVDYAGPMAERRHLSAKHGPHGRFDLNRLRRPLADRGVEHLQGGPLPWASLHFLGGTKGSTAG